MTDLTLASYLDLKSVIPVWLDRQDDDDISTKTALYIKMAEARLNRELDVVETDATLTGVSSSRSLDTSSLTIVEPIALWIVVNGDEEAMTPRPDGTFPYEGTSGKPRFWGMDASYARIDMDRPCDQAYSFRFRFVERFALSDDVTTNWLLTNHPDLYLYAALFEGFNQLQASESAAKFDGLTRDRISAVKSQLAQTKRSKLVVPPMLARIGRRQYGGNADNL